MVRFTKKLALSSAAAALLAGGGWMWLQEASAIANIPPVNTVVTCKGDKSHLIAVNQGPGIVVGTTGGIEATIGRTYRDAQGHSVTQLKINDVFSMGKVDGVGEVAIGMDKGREAGPSTLRSNEKDRIFPATQTMNFFPVIVINDEVFRASEPVNVVSSSVQSFPPEPGTTYVLTNSVTLKSDRGNSLGLEPGKAFTIGK